jgi:hypothetical protein
MSDTIMTHGYEIDWDEVLGNPHYLLATIMGARVRIPVSRQTIRRIEQQAEVMELPIIQHSRGADWEVPIGPNITNDIYLNKAKVVK